MKMNGRRAGALLLISGLSVCMLAAPAGMRAQEIDASLFERGEVLTGDALLPVAADGTRELQVNPATGEIRLKDTALGQTLCSYPEEKEGEETTSGYNAAGLRSALIIQYINTAKVMAETNSLIASVRKGGLTVHRTASGAVFTYVMPDLGITIPVACVLREGALEVSILTGALFRSSVSEESFLIMNLIQFLIRIIGCFECLCAVLLFFKYSLSQSIG